MKKQGIDKEMPVSVSALQEADEKDLYAALQDVTAKAHEQLNSREYEQAMAQMSSLKDPVDAFFDNVMVMVDDTKIRDNRIGLLQQVHTLCCQVADISQLQIKA